MYAARASQGAVKDGVADDRRGRRWEEVHKKPDVDTVECCDGKRPKSTGSGRCAPKPKADRRQRLRKLRNGFSGNEIVG
jgi:hypothetical protein